MGPCCAGARAYLEPRSGICVLGASTRRSSPTVRRTRTEIRAIVVPLTWVSKFVSGVLVFFVALCVLEKLAGLVSVGSKSIPYKTSGVIVHPRGAYGKPQERAVGES